MDSAAIIGIGSKTAQKLCTALLTLLMMTAEYVLSKRPALRIAVTLLPL